VAIRNLIELIRAAEPKAALFTTYTLSLSFFEAVLLPVLKHVGCVDIAILVDAGEARASLAEASARQAGRQYWVAKIAAPGGGYFHPKLAYLQCSKADVLAVGSGNLTLSGQSSQLENLDAVSSETWPNVFQQFSEFASELSREVKVKSRTAAALLDEHANQATRAASRTGAKARSFPLAPALMHSLRRSPLEQFGELWAQTGDKAEVLTVLSPFHAPDARPVLDLADAIGARQLAIGLEPRDLTAPFEKRLLKSKRPLRYVVPKTEFGNRKLHAKVFEVLGERGALEVCGSINATHQSLGSTKNVEVSLARWLPSACFQWKKATPRQFSPFEFHVNSANNDWAFVEATVESGNRVTGQLSSANDVPASVRVRILCGDQQVGGSDQIVRVDTDSGDFEFRPTEKLPLDGALRLDVFSREVKASCWLNVVEDLTASDEERRERQAIVPILRGDFTHDHVATLLQLLYRVAVERPMHPGGQQTAKRTGGNQSTKGGDTPFSYTRWKLSGQTLRGRGSPASRHTEALRAFLRWVNADSTDSPTSLGAHPAGHRRSEPRFREIDEEAPVDEAANIHYYLGRLITAIPEQLARKPKCEQGPLLATVAAGHALSQSLSGIPPWEGKEAPRPIVVWLDEFSRFEYNEDGYQDLVAVAIGLASVCVALAHKLQAPTHASELKQSLVTFLKDQWSPQTLEESLRAALVHDAFWNVPKDLTEAASEGLDEVLAAESLDDLIVRLARESKSGQGALSEEDKTKLPGIFEALVAQQKHPVKYPRDPVLTSEAQLGGCPHCFHTFGDDTRQRLRREQAVICPNSLCRKVVFFVQTRLMADRIKEALGYARGTAFHPPINVGHSGRRPPRTGSDH